MENKPRNIQAFPVRHDDNSETFYNEGMSLLDYFAAKAMQGIVSVEADQYPNEGIIKHTVEHAYMIAEAMLKEREKYII